MTQHTAGERFSVVKASGSKFAYVVDSTTVVRTTRFDIFKNDGWDKAVKLRDNLNKADEIVRSAIAAATGEQHG